MISNSSDSVRPSAKQRGAALLGLCLGFAPLLVPLLPMATSGCAVAEKLGVKAPSASLNSVNLLKSPSTNKMLNWGCNEYLSSATCALAGYDNKPSRDSMRFSFDIVFDLDNDNNFAVPLVEVLLGVAVFDDNNLGAVCISFCDPEVEDCTPTTDAEGACDAEGAKDVQSAGDIIPTKEELLEIASDVASGDTDDNWDFRRIPAKGSTEAHIQFDFDVDVMLGILEDLFTNAIDDAIAGRKISWDIPYVMDGSVFFDVPEMGNYAVGFGPFEDTWVVGQ